jgi:hypothetical protein
MQFPHILFRSGSVPDLDRLALPGGDASAGGVTREGVDEAGSVVVLGTIGPWGWPRGLTVFLAVRRVSGPWTRPETTEIHRGSSSSPSSSSPSWPRDEDPTAGATGLGHGPQPWTAHGRPQ